MADDDDPAVIPQPGFLDPLSPSWFLLALGVPLRLTHEDVLENPARKALHGLIRAHPGIHLRALVRATGLGFGAVSYHLRVLQDRGLVSAFPTGVRLCFYPIGVEPVAAIPPISRRRVQVLEVMEESPDAGLDEIGDALGLSPKTIAYHVRALRAAGLLEAGPSRQRQRFRRSTSDGTARP